MFQGQWIRFWTIIVEIQSILLSHLTLGAEPRLGVSPGNTKRAAKGSSIPWSEAPYQIPKHSIFGSMFQFLFFGFQF
jgi:hypothetical protein